MSLLLPRKGPHTHTLHGVEWVDDYHWLRDKANAEVIAHLEAENALTQVAMKDTADLQEDLYQEFLSRIQQTDLSVPVKDGPYLYFVRTEEGKQYPQYCRQPVLPGAPEAVYLDANQLAEGKDYFQLGVIEPSPDHRLLAYSTDYEGDEDYTIRLKDLSTGEHLPDTIDKTYDSLAWAASPTTFFYTTLDAARRPYRVCRHALGEAPPQDPILLEEPDERFRVDIYKTRSEAWMILEIASSTTTEIRLCPASEPTGEFAIFRPRQQDIEYSLSHQHDWFYLRINDRGRNFRLVRTPVGRWAEDAWEEVLPHRADVYLEGVTAFEKYLVITERIGGLRRFRYQVLGQDEWQEINFAESAYAVGLGGNHEFSTHTLRYQYQSPLTPPSVYDFHFPTREHELLKRTPVPGDFDPNRYTVERISATSHDGIQVPLILIRKTEVSSGPLLLYGYGAYGLNSDATFSTTRLSLLDRGVICVIAQVRGGAEMGQPWHDSGRMKNKPNSFRDFIACAETLIASGHTTTKQLIIEGGSAGGLLVGAALTMRPDLFGGVMAHVPFVDVVHTMLDATLPLTVGEYEEWGNPAEPDYFELIRSYSPYENTREASYPPMLVTAGLNDPRVSYWEPAKWVARLREMNRGESEILLKVNMGAGHFGASGRYNRLRELSFEFAWLLKTWNLI